MRLVIKEIIQATETTIVVMICEYYTLLLLINEFIISVYIYIST